MNALNMQKDFWLTLHFEHWSFASNGVYSKKNYWQSKLFCPLWFFKHMKIYILIMSISLGGTFDYVFTPNWYVLQYIHS